MNGHIVTRGKGRQAIVIELGQDETGKRRQKWISFKGTKQQAKEQMREILREMSAGEYVEPAKITLGTFLEQWLEYAETHTASTTFEGYRRQTRRHIIPGLGHITLEKLTPLDIQRFLSSKLQGGRADGKEGGLSTRTVTLFHTILHAALEQAIKWQLIGHNVAHRVEPPRRVKKEVVALDGEPARIFLEAIKADRLHALYLLDVATGLRRGELLGLRWRDIDFNSGWLSIRQTLVMVDGKARLQPEGKNKRSSRPVSLPPVVVKALQEHKARQDEERQNWGSEYQDNDLVFCAVKGQPLNPNNLRRDFRKLLAKAGLPMISIKSLRHTHATMLLGAGVNLKLVADRLGHSTTRMTADTYSHVMPRMRDQVANVVEKIISEVEG